MDHNSNSEENIKKNELIRICIISAGLPPHFYGGAELRAYRHAQRIRAVEGINTILLSWHRSDNRITNGSLPAYVYPVKLCFQEVGGFQTPARILKWMLHVSEIGVRLGVLLFRLRRVYDVVHIINAAPWFNLVPMPLAKVLQKPVILEMTGLGSDDPMNLNRRSRTPKQQIFPHRPLKYSLFLKADAYVSKSHALSDAYRTAGLPESKLFQIPSGVDVQKFRSPTRREKRALRHKLGLNCKSTIVLFVGGIYKSKGVHRLLAAFREVAPKHPQAQLLIVGPISRFDSSYIQAVHNDTEAWGLSERVTFVHGLVENVHEYMKAADIFALPTNMEGLSMVILEAMASGLAIVASDIPEIASSQIQHEVEGLLVPVGDTRQLSEALAELISNAATRIKLGQAARERVLREFDLEVVDRQYLSLYREILRRRPLVAQSSN